ncbi:MAG TPA: TetR/AcrR family transcriptional regulator [Thermomicrobiales bacterium]|nr:TetR/AcrR family transcriptional regulator [Thermomicrobiales bacterium]
MNTTKKPRDRILAAADELFYARGIHAVGIDEIIARSGAAKTTLYAHFPSKDDLIAGYLQRRGEEWRQHLGEELARRGGTPEERIDAVFAVLAEGCASPGFRGCPFINATAEYPDPTHPGRVVADAHRQWVHDLLAGLAAEAGAATPDALARQLILLYDAAMVGAQFDPAGLAPTSAREAVRTLVDTAVGAAPARVRTR